MKLNPNFVLRNVAQTWIVLPLADENVNFNGMLTLNASGVLLWRALEQGAQAEDLVSVLTVEYDVTPEIARADVAEFIEKLRAAGCLE